MRDIDEYQSLAYRTAPQEYRPLSYRQMELLHAALGLATETGELADVIKKHVFYGKPLGVKDLREEAGDLEWYLALLHSAVGYVMSLTLETNIAKLRQRYPDGFSETDALARADKEIQCKRCGKQGVPLVSFAGQTPGSAVCNDCYTAGRF